MQSKYNRRFALTIGTDLDVRKTVTVCHYHAIQLKMGGSKAKVKETDRTLDCEFCSHPAMKE